MPLNFLRQQVIKNGKPNIAPLQPPTLAAFRPWGSSAGAGRADLPGAKLIKELRVESLIANYPERLPYLNSKSG